MKSLIILRHADADGAVAGGSDFDRTLSDLGKSQAYNQGMVLRQTGISPERIVASSAVRTMQTAEKLVEGAGLQIEVEPEETLYNAPGAALLEFVRGVTVDCSSMLMVAHLPGVAQLLSLLTTEHEDLAQIYSPGTMAAVQASGTNWTDFDYGTGTLILFLPPIFRLS